MGEYDGYLGVKDLVDYLYPLFYQECCEPAPHLSLGCGIPSGQFAHPGGTKHYFIHRHMVCLNPGVLYHCGVGGLRGTLPTTGAPWRGVITEGLCLTTGVARVDGLLHLQPVLCRHP